MKNLKRIEPFCCFIILATVIFSCSTTSKIEVANVNDNGLSQNGAVIYALPLTVIDVCISTEEEIVVPGPYYKYAKKYLGIENAPAKPEHHWYINDVKIKQHIEADPDYVYTLSNINWLEDGSAVNRLMKDSLLLNVKDFAINEVSYSPHPRLSNEILYQDLSVKRNFESEKDVEISVVLPDTNYTNEKLRKNELTEKTLEQKAEEAANFIIKLKKRRFKLVSGQYEYMPDGEAMGEALKELARIEDEYLSLFIGKRTVRKTDSYYHYTPLTGKANDRVLLLRFSEENGFVSKVETEGVPIVIEFKALNKVKGLLQFRPSVKSPDNTFYYRIPDQVSVKLTVGEQLWAEAMFPVFQQGAIIPMSLINEQQ
jgi:hypothetical protein